MSTLTILIVVVFCLGYLSIALESLTKVNKAAIALLMCVLCWTLLMLDPASYYPSILGGDVIHHISDVIEHHLGDAAGTLFFLMGAMTIVEIVDSNGGFNFVRDTLKTRSKRKLMWRMAFMTFFLSAILDNLTTSIVMIMVLRKLVQNREDRLIYAALVVISANSGGAFSPIGDVTTIMLWIKGVITTLNEGATQFGKDLNALVQAVKDLSLAEDVKGHITGGDEIGADDVQALINIIINGQEGEQNLEVCDINGDGRITVTDIIWLQFFDIFHEWPNMAATARGGYEMSDAVKMEVVSTRGNITRLAINLSNNDSYRAFQIGMQLPAGAKVVGQSLGDRVENAYLMHSQATEGNVRFMTIAFNSEFAGNEGAVLYVDVENLNGDVALTEAYFTNVELNEADLLSSGQTTSIRESITNALESAGQKIYNMGGRVMNGLKKGINIIRRNDGSNEKVIVK